MKRSMTKEDKKNTMTKVDRMILDYSKRSTESSFINRLITGKIWKINRDE